MAANLCSAPSPFGSPQTWRAKLASATSTILQVFPSAKTSPDGSVIVVAVWPPQAVASAAHFFRVRRRLFKLDSTRLDSLEPSERAEAKPRGEDQLKRIFISSLLATIWRPGARWLWRQSERFAGKLVGELSTRSLPDGAGRERRQSRFRVTRCENNNQPSTLASAFSAALNVATAAAAANVVVVVVVVAARIGTNGLRDEHNQGINYRLGQMRTGQPDPSRSPACTRSVAIQLMTLSIYRSHPPIYPRIHPQMARQLHCSKFGGPVCRRRRRRRGEQIANCSPRSLA